MFEDAGSGYFTIFFLLSASFNFIFIEGLNRTISGERKKKKRKRLKGDFTFDTFSFDFNRNEWEKDCLFSVVLFVESWLYFFFHWPKRIEIAHKSNEKGEAKEISNENSFLSFCVFLSFFLTHTHCVYAPSFIKWFFFVLQWARYLTYFFFLHRVKISFTKCYKKNDFFFVAFLERKRRIRRSRTFT